MFYRLQLLWAKFSNRWLWIIILLIFITAWFYYYNFIYLKKSSLEQEKISTTNSWTTKKEIELTELESNIDNTNSNNIESKITKLKESLEYYKVIELGEAVFYFKNIDNSLSLYKDDTFVSSFDLYSKSDLDVSRIYSSNNYFFEIGSNYYIYDISTWNVQKIDLFVQVEYIKLYKNKYIINTNKWSYVYDNKTKNLEYFNFFEDFVYYKNWYIWIVSKNDDLRKNNLWLGSMNKNSIYFYNPKTKEKNNLYQTSIDIEKIYYSWDEIHFEDSNNKIYVLKNL